jgi:hypothetical protein
VRTANRVVGYRSPPMVRGFKRGEKMHAGKAMSVSAMLLLIQRG